MWREIPEFEGLYEVSDAGQVRRMVDMGNYKQYKAGGLLTPSPNNKGYVAVTLTKNGIQYTGMGVHRLVLLAFVGEQPEGYEVNHINGDKSDNRLENLEYVTPSENMRHAREVLGYTGERAFNAQIGNDRARYIFDTYFAGKATIKALAQEVGFSYCAVRDVIKKNTWKHIHED